MPVSITDIRNSSSVVRKGANWTWDENGRRRLVGGSGGKYVTPVEVIHLISLTALLRKTNLPFNNNRQRWNS